MKLDINAASLQDIISHPDFIEMKRNERLPKQENYFDIRMNCRIVDGVYCSHESQKKVMPFGTYIFSKQLKELTQ